MNIPKLELQLEELENDLEIVDMELLTAVGDDRYSKLKLKRLILDSIRKLNDRINKA